MGRTLGLDHSAFLALVRAGDNVLDIGANVGDYTLRYLEAVGPTGSVTAVEPMPEARAELERRTLEYARGQTTLRGQTTIVAAAIGACAGLTARMYRGEDGRHASRWPANIPRLVAGTVDVPTTTIDALVLPTTRAIKMDVQGAEVEALRGAPTTLAQRHDIAWWVELWPHGLETAQASLDILADLFASSGWRPVYGWEPVRHALRGGTQWSHADVLVQHESAWMKVRSA
jgi:FkbM family methyltransferase